MNPALNAVRAGFSRGWTEFKNTFSNPGEVAGGYLLTPAVFVGVSLFTSDSSFGTEGTSTGAYLMASGVTMLLILLGTITIAQVVGSEREDGTLLRARVVPDGMVGYTVAKTWYLLTMSLMSLLFMLVPGMVLIDGFAVQGAAGAVTLAWVCVLALLALAPVGAVVGAVLSNPRTGVGMLMLPVMGLTGISGVLFPMTLMPGWLQAVAQFFPVYWVGLGVRSAVLPPAQAAAELAGSWQLPQVAGVLALWAVVGFAAAQWVLRRMTRKTSGSRVQQAREKAMQRAY
ncbi:ABC transporter permease [Nocardiopsis changdeensis]|uniref:ABC transporter permease n=1 Tax=Nocardiopsis changdeensis TaxID=2831969 RepID=A0ABX8BRS9_9ACTN|nr:MULTISPECIES: ABC transporter permease [Nocardiopsis]QUX23078.1 ABC transporter permease [Nocardiopsis changdeensis]QYX39023.1 ABC transporter permease [Nocardiopsis sp. MT53]